MKRIIAFILAFALAFSSAPLVNADSDLSEKITILSSQEKVLFNTLTKNKVSKTDSDYILDACKIGISDYSQANKVNDKISISNLVKLFENAYRLHYGKSSKYLADFRKNISSIESCGKDGKATRYNVAELVYYSASEMEIDVKYRSLNGFISAIDKADGEDYSYLHYPNSAIMVKNKDGTVNSNTGVWSDCSDLKAIEAIGNPNAVNYTLRVFDRTSGERVQSLFADTTYRPKNKITVKTAILAVYHYYRYLMPEPKNVVVEKVGTYNKYIITNTLLKQKTDLPNASNAVLPDWKGYNLDYLSNITHGALSNMPEYWVYEADMKTVADTGANFVNVRIGWGCLSAPDYVSDDTVNIYYLEWLDHILSWGMKYGVHVQFCFTEGPGLDKTFNMQQAREKTLSVFTNEDYLELNVRYWRMLAKRYAKIPNKYLSFSLMNEPTPTSDENYAETMKPIIDAIWEDSPGRVILADIHSINCTGESMAKLGVALCYHHYRPIELFIVNKDNPQIDYQDYYNKLFIGTQYMTGILYSEDGASNIWEGKGDTSSLGGKPDIIKGNLSGTLEIMLKDSSVGKAALMVKADGVVLYDDVPETVCDGDREVDLCYSAVPEYISIPDGTKCLELSCTWGIQTFSSVKIRRDDGVLVDIPILADNFQGMDMSVVTIHIDGGIGSDNLGENELYINQKSPLISILECKATADQYGVGFMCGEWGFFDNDGGTIRKSPIPYESLMKILAGAITVFDEYGIPWCAEYRTPYTLTNSYPLNSGTTYTKIEGSSLYLDNVMNKFYTNIIKKK